MKTVCLQHTDLACCVRAAQRQRVVITRKGKPVAVMLGVIEQIELSLSDKFWTKVAEWRKQKTISRAELERRLTEK